MFFFFFDLNGFRLFNFLFSFPINFDNIIRWFFLLIAGSFFVSGDFLSFFVFGDIFGLRSTFFVGFGDFCFVPEKTNILVDPFTFGCCFCCDVVVY
jgi:hypothetical protein